MTSPWTTFFGSTARAADGKPYRALIEEAVATGGQHPSVTIDWFDLARFNEPTADLLIFRPDDALRDAAAALRERAPDANLRVRVANLPDDRKVELPALRESHIGQLVTVRGVVNSTSEVVAYPYEALFRCLVCRALFYEPQPDPMHLRDPLECKEADHGKQKAAFEFVLVDHEKGMATRRIDMQGFQLQEPPDSITGTRTPEAKPCRAFGDACGSVFPGERVLVTGILRAAPRRRGRERSAVLEYHIEVSSTEKEQSTYETILITEDDERRIKEFSKRPTLVKDLVASLAPSIHGLGTIKLGILLQLSGGVSKDLEEGRRVRGDIHVLLIGDPGQGKSALLRRAAAISPRGIYGEAPTISAPGLVGSVERMNQGLGETWVYHCGLVTMAHLGLLVVDEADKPRDEALHSSLLTPMALGIATLNKAGARGLQLKAEVAVLMGANFKDGRFEKGEPITAQIGLPPPLIDRLDLLFSLRDQTDPLDPQADQQKVAAMLRGHLFGGIRAARGAGHEVLISEAETVAAEASMKAPLDTDELRKYLAYARRSVTPVLEAATMARIMEKYALARRRRGNTDLAPVGESPRYVDSLVRLAEAAARLRLSPLVEEEDIDLAYEVWREGVEQHLRTASGELDADRIGSVESADQRQRIKSLRGIIEELGNVEPPSEEQIVRTAIGRGFAREFVLGTIQRFKDNGTLIQRGTGWTTANAVAKKKGATQ